MPETITIQGGSLAVVVKQARRTPFHERAGWVHQRLWAKQCGEEGRECLLTLSGAARWPRAPSRRSSSGRGRGLGACRGSSRRCLLCGARRPPEIGSARSRPRQHNHDPRSLLALDSHHGKARRRRHGRGFGIESTADKALDTNIERFSFLRDLQEKQRADERT